MSGRDNIYVLLTFVIVIIGCIGIYAMPSYQFTEAGEYESQLKEESEHILIAESAKAEIAPAQNDIELVTYQEERQQETFITDIRLDTKLQYWIIDYCTERKISPALVFAIIETESNYESECIGDNGEAAGLMQIQTKWHQERIEKLGITDLLDPYQNIRVGIDYLLELFEKNPDTQWVLDAYNGGQTYANRMKHKGIETDYSKNIVTRAIELERCIYGND